MAGSLPDTSFPVVAERDHLTRLAGFGTIGVGVDQVMGSAVLSEESQNGAGALGTGRHVVLLKGGVVAPVHHGVEVQVEIRSLAVANPAWIICLSRAAKKRRWWSRPVR